MAQTIEKVLEQVHKCQSGCWEWQGYRQKGGYGLVSFQGRKRTVHGVVYEQLIGPIPEGLELDHLCRNRACCNPEHMELVTHRENLLRGDTFAARHSRVTHCPRGHQYDEANTRVYKGMRHCRACQRVDPANRKPVGRPSRLPPGAHEAIRAACAAGTRHRELAARYQVSRALIYLILNHKVGKADERAK